MTTSQSFDRRDAIDAAAVGFMLVLTFSWGLNGVAAKLTNAGYNPIFLNVARSAIACALVFLWCQFRGIRLFERDGTLFGGILRACCSEFSSVSCSWRWSTRPWRAIRCW